MPDAADVFLFIGLAMIGAGVYLVAPDYLGYYLLALGILFTGATVWSIVKHKARLRHGLDH